YRPCQRWNHNRNYQKIQPKNILEVGTLYGYSALLMAAAADIEVFPLSRVNEALSHLESGKARYRIVLRNDFK
ncbi:MAG: hypothetical protein WA421_00100, partial [Nitrososphaeraceae archaeon]